jgi:hypothetical protein
MEQVMRQHFMVQPQPTGALNLAISPALDAVILRALEKQPDKRFPSILEFALAFQQALQPTGNQAPIVLGPKNEEAFTVPGDAIELKKISLADSAPLPSTAYTEKTGELASTVAASNPNLSAQDPTVTDINIDSRNSETPKPLPVSRVSSTKKWSRQTQVLVALVMLIVISSVVGVGIYQSHVNQENASATASAYDATSQVNDDATSTAQAHATATAQVIAANLYPSYLPGNGTLAFVDPLSQESASKWSSSSTNSTGGACLFTGGTYHASEQNSQYFMNCSASGTFSNFAMEVQLTITRGDCGGMVFRKDLSQSYDFHICQNGTYKVIKYVSSSGSDAKTLYSSSSPAVHTGLGQQNKIAVVASGSTLLFYVNGQQIDREQDRSYTSGSIGLIAYPGFHNATDVAYSNARLWTL